MERRGPQRSNRNNHPATGHRSRGRRKTTESELKLAIQSNSWLRIGQRAKNKDATFSNLLCHFSVENLREAYRVLDGRKARGIDGITKEKYGESLDTNLEDLVSRIHTGTYRPQKKKRTFIPKANGKLRPIAISAFEDKLVEWVTAKVLSAIYEPSFIPSSYGFREKRGAHGALKTTYESLKKGSRSFVVEIDLESFFDTISHRRMIKILQKRIRDKRLLSLVSRFLTAGILGEETITDPTKGAPQGSIMSPVLANIFLHECIDSWFVENHANSDAVIVRYADDAVFFFNKEKAAKEFLSLLRSRVQLFGLKLNEEKSRTLLFRRNDGNVFHFLGFTFFWSAKRGSRKRELRVKTARKVLAKKIGEYTEWVKRTRSWLPINAIWRVTAAKLRGHYAYYGIGTNRPKLNHYYQAVIWSLFRWLNRRSQKRSFSWRGFQARLLRVPLPTPPEMSALLHLDSFKRRVYAY